MQRVVGKGYHRGGRADSPQHVHARRGGPGESAQHRLQRRRVVAPPRCLQLVGDPGRRVAADTTQRAFRAQFGQFGRLPRIRPGHCVRRPQPARHSDQHGVKIAAGCPAGHRVAAQGQPGHGPGGHGSDHGGEVGHVRVHAQQGFVPDRRAVPVSTQVIGNEAAGQRREDTQGEVGAGPCTVGDDRRGGARIPAFADGERDVVHTLEAPLLGHTGAHLHIGPSWGPRMAGRPRLAGPPHGNLATGTGRSFLRH